MRFPIFFYSISAVRSVADLQIAISPQRSRFEIFPWRGSPLLERTMQRQMFNTSATLIDETVDKRKLLETAVP